MHEKFKLLNPEKRDRIINAAMQEFSEKGFKNASTNEIVKKAGISKGALFHYFSSKQELFEFLYHYSSDVMVEIMESQIDNMPDDVFERWIAFAKLKMGVAVQYPNLADFMQRTFKDDTTDVQKLIKEEFARFSKDFSQKVYQGIDLSKFKPDVDVQKALQTIWWVLEGYALTKQQESINLTQARDAEFQQGLIDEMESYLAILRKSFYQEEYL